MALSAGQRVYRSGAFVRCGATVQLVDGDIALVAYDEGGQGYWDATALMPDMVSAVGMSLDAAKAVALAETVVSRRAAVSGGCSFGGSRTDTDDVAIGRVTGAAVAAMLDANYTLRWKVADGVFVELSAPQVLAMATAVRQHVQACFDREALLSEQIAATTTMAELAAVSWWTGW